tara:strand:+ start:1885 stop:3135 length:1251 start_codon:yes stop_codon:yes gene_type:complete
MPRLSLWKPNKGNDYKFADRTIKEHFLVGGTGVFVHRYIGPHINTNSVSSDQPTNSITSVLNIQDMLFGENRDRKYDSDVFDLRGVYSVADQDFDLTQFGLFQTNDTIFITFHINDMIDRLGRKIMPGDVFEMPHLEDDTRLESASITLTAKPTKKFRKGETITGGTSSTTATVVNYNHEAKTIRITPIAGNFDQSETITGDKSGASATVSSFTPKENLKINKFYVVEDTGRGSDGYDPGWWPHIWRCRAVAMQDTQEFRDIIGSGDSAEDLKNIISTYQSEIDINDAVINQAKANVPTKGMEVGHLYTNQKDTHKINLRSQDGTAGKGITISHTGNSFPSSITEGQYVLRTDYAPSRLFRKEGNRFIKVSENMRGTFVTSNKELDSFINNDTASTVTTDGKERQYLSKVIKPKAD